MSKHTPGPWFTGVSYGFPGRVHAKLEAIGHVRRFVAVADVLLSQSERMGDREVLDDERNANARLIAAAPDLLEALRNALTQVADATSGYPERERHETPAATIARAEAAIAKAEGKL